MFKPIMKLFRIFSVQKVVSEMSYRQRLRHSTPKNIKALCYAFIKKVRTDCPELIQLDHFHTDYQMVKPNSLFANRIPNDQRQSFFSDFERSCLFFTVKQRKVECIINDFLYLLDDKQKNIIKEMFEQEHISNVVVKVKRNGKQQNYSIDLQVNEGYEVDLTTLTAILKSLRAYQEDQTIFYFHHTLNHYLPINEEQPFVHFNNLVKENLIFFQVQRLLSDQILANPKVQPSAQRRYKRNRQKTIEEAFLLVDQWRKLYREGIFDQKGQLLKINLDQAAEIINTPRKTLEDYFLLFRKGHQANFKFKENKCSKIGTLRSFLKENPPGKQQSKQKIDEKKFFKLISPELLPSNFIPNQNEIFDILEEVNSDQDILFEN